MSALWRIIAQNACRIGHISKPENAKSALYSTMDVSNALEQTTAANAYQPPFILTPKSVISAKIICPTAKLASIKQTASLVLMTTTL
jgi:hypothetical protein